MAELYYAGLAAKEIDSFERTLERILGNLTEHDEKGDA